MKNIESILIDAGLELTDEQKEAVTKAVAENYKTIADYNKKVDKIETLEASLKETKDSLSKFDGVDAEGLNKKIKELEETIKANEDAYDAKIKDRDFDDLVNGIITENKGLNSKAIKALLDIDALKASNNQKEDVISAVKALTEDDNSKMLFGEVEPTPNGKVNPIGSFGKTPTGLTGVEKAFYERTGVKLE